jgi:hypothetical protein
MANQGDMATKPTIETVLERIMPSLRPSIPNFPGSRLNSRR